MKTLLIYKSKTGFTKRYADWIAEETGCDTSAFGDTSAEAASKYDRIVFGSRVHAGRIDGLKKAIQLYGRSGAKELVVFATGGTPLEATEVIERIRKDNFTRDEIEKIPFFYMQSGVCYEKMGFVDRTIMKLAAKMMSKKKDKDDNEQGFEQAITSSYDCASKDRIAPIVGYLKGNKE